MADSRVFISYDRNDLNFVNMLATDLSAGGIEVTADDEAISLNQIVHQVLPREQWLLLVRSPDAERSKRVQGEVEAAMDYTVNQRMQGVLSISSPSSTLPTPEAPAAWTVIRSFTGTDRPSYERSLQSLLRIVSGEQQHQAQSLVQAKPLPRAEPSMPSSDRTQNVRRPATPPGRAVKSRLLPGIVAVTLVVVLLVTAIYYIVQTRRSGSTLYVPPVTSPTTSIATAPPTVLTSPTAAPIVITDPQGFYNHLQQTTPTLIDPMNGTSTNMWDRNGTSCVFAPHYHIMAPSGRYSPCMLQGHSYTNFAYQVSMTLNDGNAGGLIFRADQTANQPMTTFYRFSLDTNGNIVLRACTACQGNYVTTEGTSVVLPVSTVQYQSTAGNTIAVIVSGATIYLFVNQKFVTQVTDNQVQTGGGIGLYAASISDASPTAMAAFSDLKVWKL